MPTVPTSNVVPMAGPAAAPENQPSPTHFAMALATMHEAAKQAEAQKKAK